MWGGIPPVRLLSANLFRHWVSHRSDIKYIDCWLSTIPLVSAQPIDRIIHIHMILFGPVQILTTLWLFWLTTSLTDHRIIEGKIFPVNYINHWFCFIVSPLPQGPHSKMGLPMGIQSLDSMDKIEGQGRALQKRTRPTDDLPALLAASSSGSELNVRVRFHDWFPLFIRIFQDLSEHSQGFKMKLVCRGLCLSCCRSQHDF